MPGRLIDRRQFLSSAGATAAFFAVHDLAAAGAQTNGAPAEPKQPHLLSLELLAGASTMAAMRTFYGKTLDLRLLDDKADRFTVEAGESAITFVASDDAVDGRAPFYHFAFNIPENKIVKALEWQKARAPMLAIPERNQAAGLPPEVVDYRHWNAHSVFFLDPAGNVVEYIARHDLKNGDDNPFGWSDILYVSEIGLIVDDVPAAATAIGGLTPLAAYKGGDSNFTAMGDEYGLLLVMKRGRVVDFTGNAAHGVRPYPTGVNVRGPKAATHHLPPHPYRLTIEERCSCA